MIRKQDIPEIAICHKCGNPMKVIDVSALAKSLGYTAPSGLYALQCCGFEQTIDDPEHATQILDILLAYYAQEEGVN